MGMKNLRKIPQFWHSDHKHQKATALSYALLPLSWIYRAVVGLDRAFTIKGRSKIPVICIGNVTMGGAGKTPTARTILSIIKDHGKFHTPCFLMRGYGGNYSGALEVDPSLHTTWDVGDEALMQVRYAPTIVSRNRKKGAELATERGYDLIIMDDGFQNFSLHKTLSILVIDGGFGFGNGKCFPAGPLRESVSDAVSRSHAALIINKSDAFNPAPLKDTRQFEASLDLVEYTSSDKDNKTIIAFAGIARPEKFFETLRDNGFILHSEFGFADHHRYTHGQLNHLYQRAQKANARLVTTEKDWVRLSDNWKSKIDYIKIAVRPEDSFKHFIHKVLDRLSVS
jgi:tetraacyldisaccharide 4'-kinase